MKSQLGAQDSAFLYLQDREVLTHVTTISIYEPAPARGGKRRSQDIASTLISRIASRCEASPVYRRRLYRVPLDLDYAYWIEDADFDPATHVTRRRLPRPGDWSQLCRLAAAHFAEPMDLGRPLWDIVVVEGLERVPGVAPGSYALLQRFHHAAIDGASGTHAMLVLSDRDARGTPVLAAQPATAGLGEPPSPLEIVSRAVSSGVAAPARLLGALTRLSPALVAAAGRQLVDPRPGRGGQVPATRFNARVSPRRAFDGVSLPLSQLGAIRRLVAGATINDVILAVCSGGLRNYLLERGELPDSTLAALVPVNSRSLEGDAVATGNDISAMAVDLATHLAGPVARLAAIRDCTREAKQARAGVGARALAELSRHVPGLAMAGVARLVGTERLTRGRANLIITNVPGTQHALYMNGARLVRQFGMGPVAHGMGLFIAAIGHDGRIGLSLTADPELVPDLRRLRGHVEAALAELRDAVDRGSRRKSRRSRLPS
jgi:WS/DGAT/MGAT family acyltransferase